MSICFGGICPFKKVTEWLKNKNCTMSDKIPTRKIITEFRWKQQHIVAVVLARVTWAHTNQYVHCAQVQLTWDGQLSGPELVWNRHHPTLSVTQTDKLPTVLSDCPDVRKKRMRLYWFNNTNIEYKMKIFFFFFNCEMLHVMYFSQIFYKIPRGCLHPSIPWKAKTNHCLFSCCWTIVVLWSVPH